MIHWIFLIPAFIVGEGNTRKVLLLAGGFAYEHKGRIFVTRTENAVGSRLVQGTFFTFGAFLFEVIPSHISLPSFLSFMYTLSQIYILATII